jgi:hypothetical protein
LTHKKTKEKKTNIIVGNKNDENENVEEMILVDGEGGVSYLQFIA